LIGFIHKEGIMTSGDSKVHLPIKAVRDAANAEAYLPSLCRLLQSCVNDEPSLSSIGFFAPFSDKDAEEYWLTVLPTAVTPSSDALTEPAVPPQVTLLVVTDPDDALSVIATIQIARHPKATHAYKGEIRKLLVHSNYRRHGLGRRLMSEIERIGKEDMGLEMIILDTAIETAARDFYISLGWTQWGICPKYAKFADGRKADCIFFYKEL
jgi:GNAT superfamily N-acetyltransferase